MKNEHNQAIKSAKIIIFILACNVFVSAIIELVSSSILLGLLAMVVTVVLVWISFRLLFGFEWVINQATSNQGDVKELQKEMELLKTKVQKPENDRQDSGQPAMETRTSSTNANKAEDAENPAPETNSLENVQVTLLYKRINEIQQTITRLEGELQAARQSAQETGENA